MNPLRLNAALALLGSLSDLGCIANPSKEYKFEPMAEKVMLSKKQRNRKAHCHPIAPGFAKKVRRRKAA